MKFNALLLSLANLFFIGRRFFERTAVNEVHTPCRHTPCRAAAVHGNVSASDNGNVALYLGLAPGVNFFFNFKKKINTVSVTFKARVLIW